ncbi:cupin domain [Roseivirga ehrenbergii]|uniref:Cupin n=1 Tax=Roseivirga ehrenbergii (strain DSM 102268 / JCM 13514 / KCTC 12282 / NCIMB 14502 / KMM 6017) TaxID=279360 RepID=A0A150X7Y4_ROSEK|nr:cupin domain-containing protein [Roseivirga ehrenbergii]KYG74796.1 cupin [Roseivirga ehrenbergii]TCL13872.1 cupin domain [Roseivirga ehrenbergii]|tara:strand:+ start:4725 stop:5093 length:369 start_codon:yes stop_codon:yes gene_type:complete
MEKVFASKEFLFGNELEWEDVGPGLKRQIMGYDNKILMARVLFEKGAIGEVHEHHHSQATYVVSGAFELQVGTEKKIIKAGDGFYIPPHVDHGAICLEKGELIDVFSPIREDFFSSNIQHES